MKNDKRTRPAYEIWDAVCTTDPAHTKQINQRGGFTAIDAQYQIKTATGLWGPMGEAWGVRDCVYGYVTGGDNLPPVEAWFEGVFYYPDGTIEISTDMVWRAGDECRKKLRTNALTKALSQLGFNSDVFEGKFDDNQYVADQRRQSSPAPRDDRSRPSPRPDPQNGSPSQQGGGTGIAGRGGSDQLCIKCGAQGVTPGNFDPSTRRPDAECPAGCVGDRQKNDGSYWPLSWWTVPKGSNPPPPRDDDERGDMGDDGFYGAPP